MGRVLDITDRLSFEEGLSLQIKDKKIEVNYDAPTVLKVMGLIGTTEAEIEDFFKAYDLLFPEKSRKELDKLKLSFPDLAIVIKMAIELITGESLGE